MLVRRAPLYPTVSFLPSDLPNLKVWYKADAMVTNSDATSDGDAVTKWTDSSGNNWQLYDQNTTSKRPTYKTNQVNSLPAVSFNGTSNELRTGSAGGGGSSVTWGSAQLTLFLVLQDNSANPGAGVGLTWVNGDDGGGFPMFYMQRYTNTGNARFRGFNTSGTSFDTFAAVSNGLNASDWHIISAIVRATEVQSYIDGAANTAVTITGTPQNKSTPFWMAGIFGSSFTKVKIAECYVYTSALSSTDRHSNEQYLSSKYGISVASQ